jgi:hypothetical protein
MAVWFYRRGCGHTSIALAAAMDAALLRLDRTFAGMLAKHRLGVVDPQPIAPAVLFRDANDRLIGLLARAGAGVLAARRLCQGAGEPHEDCGGTERGAAADITGSGSQRLCGHVATY